MTRSGAWAAVAVMLLSSVGGTPAAAQIGSADTVAGVLTVFAALTQDKDVAGMDTLVAHDAWVRIIEGAGVNQGWADYRDHHLVPELAEFENFRYRYFAIEPQVRGAVAWAPFQYDLAADTPRGHVEVEGRGTAVLERRGGRWVIVHLHTSGRRKPTN